MILLVSTCSFGQVQPGRLQEDMKAGAGISFETWNAEGNKVTELAIPLTFVYPVSPKMRLYAMTAPALSSVNAGEKYGLNGLSDMKWGGHFLTFNDQVLFTFGLNLPTGKSALEVEEYAVANVLAMPIFNFRVPTMGQGFDLHAGANSAREFGDWVVGFGASYLVKGGYKPLKEFTESYNPGDEISLTAGADRNVLLFGKEMRVKGDLVYTLYFNDTWGKTKVFKSGNRILFQLMSTFKTNRLDMGIFVRERLKGKNKRGSGDVYETERNNSNSNQFEIQTWGYYPYSRTKRLKGVVDVKMYSDNDFQTGGAFLLGIGGGGQFRLNPKMVFSGELRLYTGNINTGAGKSSTTGVKIFGGLEYTL